MHFNHVFLILPLALPIAGCNEVEPSDPGEPPVLTISEKRADGTFRVAYTNDPGLRAVRTTCDDGRVPNEFLAAPDVPATWNEYYVLAPDQTEATFFMTVVSASGVTVWNMSVEEDYAVTNPASPILPFGATVFSMRTGPPYFSVTTDEFTVEQRSGFARAGINAIVESGSAGGLEFDEGDFLLFSADCRRAN